MAFLLKHDSVGGMLRNEVKANDHGFSVDGREVKKLEVMDPAEIPWARPRRRRRDRVDRPVHRPREGGRPPRRRREAGRHLRAERRRRRDDLHRRERRGVRPRAAHTSSRTRRARPTASRRWRRCSTSGSASSTASSPRCTRTRPTSSSRTRRTATRSGKPDLRRMRAAALSIIPSSTGAAPRHRGRAAGAQGPARRHVAAGADARPARSPTSSRSCRPRGVGRGDQRRVRRGRRRPVVPRRARVQRRAARVGRHRRQPVVVHLLRARHDGERQPREGARLVRQRVGLLEPPRRPRRFIGDRDHRTAPPMPLRHPASRRPAAGTRRSACCCASTSTSRCATASSRTTCASRPCCRPSQWLHERGAASSRAGTSAVRRARPTRSTRWRRSRRGSASCSGPRSRSRRRWSGPDGGSRASPGLADGRMGCSRTCASSRGRPRTTPAFAGALVDGCDAYVNEAFGASHRAHASIVGPPAILPSAGGRLLLREVEVLSAPARRRRRSRSSPCSAARRSATSSASSTRCSARCETILVGGAMAFTFLVAQGHGDRRLARRARHGRRLPPPARDRPGPGARSTS